MARRNTGTQEKYISSLNTSGALDEGSGFDANFGQGETNEQYAARLEAWKGSRGGSSAGGGGGLAAGPSAAIGALGGLQAASGAAPAQAQPTIGESGAGGPVDLPAVGALRQGLGQRMYPELYSALAGLKRIY